MLATALAAAVAKIPFCHSLILALLRPMTMRMKVAAVVEWMGISSNSFVCSWEFDWVKRMDELNYLGEVEAGCPLRESHLHLPQRRWLCLRLRCHCRLISQILFEVVM